MIIAPLRQFAKKRNLFKGPKQDTQRSNKLITEVPILYPVMQREMDGLYVPRTKLDFSFNNSCLVFNANHRAKRPILKHLCIGGLTVQLPYF